MTLIADLIRAGVDPDLVARVADEIAEARKGSGARGAARKAIQYSADFEAFWKAYPTDQGMSKFEAWQIWQKIDETERVLAMQAIAPFKEWLKKQPSDYRTIHACRFLSKKRFEGHAQSQLKLVASNNGRWVSRESPEWSVLADAYRKSKGKYPPIDGKGGWFFGEEIAANTVETAKNVVA